jgi:hypothetical protein
MVKSKKITPEQSKKETEFYILQLFDKDTKLSRKELYRRYKEKNDKEVFLHHETFKIGINRLTKEGLIRIAYSGDYGNPVFYRTINEIDYKNSYVLESFFSNIQIKELTDLISNEDMIDLATYKVNVQHTLEKITFSYMEKENHNLYTKSKEYLIKIKEFQERIINLRMKYEKPNPSDIKPYPRDIFFFMMRHAILIWLRKKIIQLYINEQFENIPKDSSVEKEINEIKEIGRWLESNFQDMLELIKFKESHPITFSISSYIGLN